MSSVAQPRTIFLVVLAATLVFRFWLAGAMPMTGDEAYFIRWGEVPDWGFYDHPPMVGWWLAALLFVSDGAWWLRLPVVLMPGVLALGIAWLLRASGVRHGWLAATAFLLLPANVWNVFITTDTPLIYFSFFSALAFLSAARGDVASRGAHADLPLHALAGALLGLALLSKYFAVLLGIAYCAHAVWRPTRAKIVGLAVTLAATLPFVALNVWWNWQHCWANIMFNLYNRHEGAGLSWHTPLLYAATLLYLFTPPLFWLMWRRRAAIAAIGQGHAQPALLWMALGPLALFAALSSVKQIGLHWLLSFLPFAVVLLALVVEESAMQRWVRFLGAFALVHVLAIGVIAALPLETWKRTRLYDGIVLTFESARLLEQLQPYAADYVFASDGYSNAATLGYNARRHFLVFGEASSHARHDDILSDFRALDGRNVLVLRKTAPEMRDYLAYFREVDLRHFDLRGARFHIVLGRGFRYSAYRDGVLAKVREKYYAIPRYLPVGQCYFCERYFPTVQCRSSG